MHTVLRSFAVLTMLSVPALHSQAKSSVTVISGRLLDADGKPRRMIKQPDGRYTLDVETSDDTVAYQLLGVTKEKRSINGTSSDRFFYDGGGDYRSVLRVEKGKTTIVFDPRRLQRRSGERR